MAQVADVQEMLFGWRGTFVVTLNAEWDADGISDTDLASFMKSFEHVYCFGPLDIQVCNRRQSKFVCTAHAPLGMFCRA